MAGTMNDMTEEAEPVEEKAQLLLHKESVSTFDADSVHSRSDTELEAEDDWFESSQAPRVIPCTEIPPPNTFRDSGYVNVVSTYIIDSPDMPEEPLPPSPDLLPPDPTTIELAPFTLMSQTPTGRTSSKKTSTSRSQNSTSRSQNSTSRSRGATPCSQDGASHSEDASVTNTTMNTNPHAQFAALQDNDVAAGDPVPGEGEDDMLSLVPISLTSPDSSLSSPPTVPPRMLPPSYFRLAICATLLCLPIGLVAIVNACQVGTLHSKGEVEKAMQSSRKARKWSIASIAVGVGCLILFLLIVAVVVVVLVLF